MGRPRFARFLLHSTFYCATTCESKKPMGNFLSFFLFEPNHQAEYNDKCDSPILPPEFIVTIAKKIITDSTTLKHLCEVSKHCKQFHSLITPILYKSISFSIGHLHDYILLRRKLNLFCQTQGESRGPLQYVREVQIKPASPDRLSRCIHDDRPPARYPGSWEGYNESNKFSSFDALSEYL